MHEIEVRHSPLHSVVWVLDGANKYTPERQFGKEKMPYLGITAVHRVIGSRVGQRVLKYSVVC